MRTMQDKDYNKEAKIFVKKLLLEEDITYKDLSLKLNNKGFQYTEASINQKINRGRFDFAFVLQVLDVLNLECYAKEIS